MIKGTATPLAAKIHQRLQRPDLVEQRKHFRAGRFDRV
jgi:hypothetical protein